MPSYGVARRLPGAIDTALGLVMGPLTAPNPVPSWTGAPFVYDPKFYSAIKKQLANVAKVVPELAGNPAVERTMLNTAGLVPAAALHRMSPKGLVELRNNALLGMVGKKAPSISLADKTEEIKNEAYKSFGAVKQQLTAAYRAHGMPDPSDEVIKSYIDTAYVPQMMSAHNMLAG